MLKASTTVTVRPYGYSNIETAEIYADYAPDPNRGAAWAPTAFPDA